MKSIGTDTRQPDPTLYPDGDYSFDSSGGPMTDGHGKWYWPALLRLTMPRPDALRTIHSLLVQLEDNAQVFDLTFSGKIERQDDEGNPLKMDGSPLDGDA